MNVIRNRIISVTAGCLAVSVLTACAASEDLLDRFGLRGRDDGDPVAVEAGQTVLEDAEAPEVFSVTASALWDGRPSLGGIWVAHPDVDQPERVIIRNASNGRSVVGALFRREREVPGPVLQVSSDAAEALRLVAGTPQQIEVVALRRKEVPVEAPQTVAAGTGAAPEDVIETTLDPVAIATDANYPDPGAVAGRARSE